MVNGLAWLFVLVGYLRRARWGRPTMVVAAVCSLWYLAIGALSSVVQLALLAVGAVARRRESPGPTATSAPLEP